MALQSDPNATPRIPLTRERVLRAAIVLADEGGIESLSMRKLGQQLGVEAMSLYNHVANKDDILDGIVDVVVSEIDVPPPGRRLEDRPAAASELSPRRSLAPPLGNGLIESRTNPGPATLRYYDSVIGSLREAGFSIEMAATRSPRWTATSMDSRSRR